MNYAPVVACPFCGRAMTYVPSGNYRFFLCSSCGSTTPKIRAIPGISEKTLIGMVAEKANSRKAVHTHFDEITYSPKELVNAVTALFSLSRVESSQFYKWLNELC